MLPQIKYRKRFSPAWWCSYLLAVCGSPLLIWVLPGPLTGRLFPITTVMLIPIMISAYLGGFISALLAIASAMVTVGLSDWWRYSALGLAVSVPFNVGRWAIFVFMGLMIGALMEFAHRARSRTEASELRLASTLATIDEAVVVTDQAGLIEYVNTPATALIQANSKEIVGKPFGDVFRIVNMDAQSSDEEFSKLLQTPIVTPVRSDRYALLGGAGQRIPLEISVAPIRIEDRFTSSAVITLRDCSDRQHTEQALRERIALQEQLATIARMLPGALHAFRKRPDGSSSLVYASPSFADIYGLDPELLRRDGSNMTSTLHPDDAEWVNAHIGDATSLLLPIRIEHRVLHPKKGLVWIELHSVPVREADGGILWNGIFFDVTLRKLAEQSLKESEARLLGIVDAAMDGIVTLHDQQGIVVFNPAAERMFRCTEAGMLGITLEGFVSSYLHGDSSLVFNMLKRDEISNLRLGELSNLYGRRGDGEVFPLEVSVSRTEVSGHRLLTMTLRDITERKHAADRLQTSQQQLRAALEAGSMGVMRLYTTDREVEFDEKAADLCGVKQPPHTRQPLAVLQQVIHPGDRLRLAREYLRAVAHHAAFLTECRTLRDDGSVRWLLFRGGVLLDDGAQGAQLTAIITDVTYRKQVEEQRLRSQKLESLGVLAGGIAHDFNNLLLAISGNLKLAMADLHEPHPAMASLREISKAASRAVDLVRRILAFSRPQDHHREAVNLDAMLEEVLGLARAVLPASIAMRVFTPEASPIVLADATQIHQALINLLTNAADAVPASGGEIEIHREVVDIDAGMLAAEPQLQAGHRYARVTIADNGLGMDAATLQRIFDPFYTTKPLGQGTGLGLPIVHGIMKGHEGVVTVHSEVGRGTRFALYFPVHTTAVMPPTPVTALPSAGRQGHILYVDDEEALVYLMTRTLQRMGHQVTARTAPEQALAVLMQDPDAFDLVVTDMSMPGMSGLELARKILAVRPQLPVVITTGFVRAEDYEAATAAGVRQLILKPNTINELGATIQSVLQGQEIEASVR